MHSQIKEITLVRQHTYVNKASSWLRATHALKCANKEAPRKVNKRCRTASSKKIKRCPHAMYQEKNEHMYTYVHTFMISRFCCIAFIQMHMYLHPKLRVDAARNAYRQTNTLGCLANSMTLRCFTPTHRDDHLLTANIFVLGWFCSLGTTVPLPVANWLRATSSLHTWSSV